MGELQDRRDAQTRAELSAAAVQLFASQGFVETTVADVAEAAGVSRRTAYRHFANKEDLLFEQARLWMQVFDDVVDQRLPKESTRDVCWRAVLAVARTIEEGKDEVLLGYGVVAATPSLAARYARTNRDWLDAYFGLLMSNIDDDNTESTLQASLVAGALMSGTDRAVIHWFLHPEEDLAALTRRVLELAEPLWPDETRS